MLKRVGIFMIGLLLAATASATTVGGVTLPDNLTFGEHEMFLNGAGLRKKLWIKVYAGGLYLTQTMHNANEIIDADEPMAVRMHFIYDGVSAEKLIETWNEGFETVLGKNMASLQAELDAFNALFTKEAAEGDRYDIVYLPESGTHLYINGTEIGSVAGLKFKQALFAIWLGDDPADDNLKEGMLGE